MKAIFLFVWVLILSSQHIVAQYYTVSGKIKDALSDESIENFSIFESESGIGTISGEDGFFKLILSPGNRSITFSGEGYKSEIREFKLQRDTILNLSINPINYKQKEKGVAHLSTGSEGNIQGSHKHRFLFF